MSEKTYYQTDREVILNRAKEYYKNNNEVLRKKQENDIKREYGRSRYKNMLKKINKY